MRKTYHMILKSCFRADLLRTRNALGFTQAQMAEKLAIDERSYSDLDRGKSCCSAITLCLYLIYLCQDTQAFLEELRYAIECGKNQVA